MQEPWTVDTPEVMEDVLDKGCATTTQYMSTNLLLLPTVTGVGP